MLSQKNVSMLQNIFFVLTVVVNARHKASMVTSTKISKEAANWSSLDPNSRLLKLHKFTSIHKLTNKQIHKFVKKQGDLEVIFMCYKLPIFAPT